MQRIDIHELTPLNAAELTGLGRDLILAREYDPAMTVLQAAIGKDRTYRRAYALLEYLLELQGNYDAALELHEDYNWLKMSRTLGG